MIRSYVARTKQEKSSGSLDSLIVDDVNNVSYERTHFRDDTLQWVHRTEGTGTRDDDGGVSGMRERERCEPCPYIFAWSLNLKIVICILFSHWGSEMIQRHATCTHFILDDKKWERNAIRKFGKRKKYIYETRNCVPRTDGINETWLGEKGWPDYFKYVYLFHILKFWRII